MMNGNTSFSRRIERCIKVMRNREFSINNNRRIEDLLSELLTVLEMRKVYNKILRFNDENKFELLLKNYRFEITPTTYREVNINMMDEDSGKVIINTDCKIVDMQDKILELIGEGLVKDDDDDSDDLSIENAIRKTENDGVDSDDDVIENNDFRLNNDVDNKRINNKIIPKYKNDEDDTK